MGLELLVALAWQLLKRIDTLVYYLNGYNWKILKGPKCQLLVLSL